MPCFLKAQQPILGLEQTARYKPYLAGKRIGLVVHQASEFKGGGHLVDSVLVWQQQGLTQLGAVWVPEHGFRGDADAGAAIAQDSLANGTPIFSLYGKHKAPSTSQLARVDVILFDLQDVGARFYTYISTLEYVLKAALAEGKQVIVLDRPNPNGDRVEGPMLDTSLRSFVGRQPIPVVHGLTMGEYASMLIGEGWVAVPEASKAQLQVVKVLNYTHSTSYSPSVKPSPNLPNRQAIRLYPSLCLFEGTPVSVGRGTDFPFQVYGAPVKAMGSFAFVPQPRQGATAPPYAKDTCWGMDLRGEATALFDLQHVIAAYKAYPKKEEFFKPFFDKLIGDKKVASAIRAGKTAKQIERTWRKGLKQYIAIRAKYLLYPDK